MLRKDIKYMLDKEWEPSVPQASIIRKQSAKFDGRLSGSVRLAKGRVATNESHSYNKKRNRLQKIAFTK